MKRISESHHLMTDIEQCKAYNDSLVDSYDLVEYTNLYKKYLNLSSGKILDLGSGSCNFVIALCLEFPGLIFDCYEQSDTMINIAKENIEKYGLKSQINIIKDDLMNASGSYDAVLINRVLHHIENPNQLWQNISNISQNVFALDLERPDNIESLDGLFRLMEQMNFNPIFVFDTKRSFMAGYTKDEVLEQIKNYSYSIERLTNEPIPGVKYNKLAIYQKR